jgi:hypothetical protein
MSREFISKEGVMTLSWQRSSRCGGMADLVRLRADVGLLRQRGAPKIDDRKQVSLSEMISISDTREDHRWELTVCRPCYQRSC